MRRGAGSSPCFPRLQHGVSLTEVANAANVPVHEDRKGRRREGLDRYQRAHAVDLYRSRKHTMKQICSLMAISRATLYAYVEELSKQS